MLVTYFLVHDSVHLQWVQASPLNGGMCDQVLLLRDTIAKPSYSELVHILKIVRHPGYLVCWRRLLFMSCTTYMKDSFVADKTTYMI